MVSMSFLVLSTVLCFFSNSWLIIWILLEVNTLSFCSLKFKKVEMEKKMTGESFLKYLLIQSIASSILVGGCLVKESNESFSKVLMMLTVGAIAIKLAAAPLHFWFVSVSKKLAWPNNMILFTWQKVMPLYLVLFQKKVMFFMLVVTSSVMGSIFMLNKKSMKEIMALSSIFNLGWLIAAISLSVKVMIFFSVLYWTSLLYFVKDLTSNKKTMLEEMGSNQLNKMTFFFKSINLAGIPPLMGFLAKWTVFISMVKMKLLALPSVMLVLSSMNIFVYLRMSSKGILKNSKENQKEKKGVFKMSETFFFLLNLIILQMYS